MKTFAKLVLFGACLLLLTWLCFSENGPRQSGFFDGFLGRSSNCGGNTAALNVCRQYGYTLRIISEESGQTNALNIFEIAKTNQMEIAKAAQSHWTPDAVYRLKTNISFEHPEKEMVIVCTQRYENIPQPTFWNGHRKTPAHAIGYLDGSSKLISPAEFKSLDLSEFISAEKLLEAP